MLRETPNIADSRLLVGIATGDDAGVFRIAPGIAIVQTVDFFTPIVDDAETFGRIAAANALSDVYAMGGVPLTALNMLCFPVGDRGAAEAVAILRGAAAVVAEAGAVVVGGHSVEDPEPKFGMAVTGSVDPDAIATNAGARPGDVIVLTKPIGTGVMTTAAKFDACPAESLDAACASMMRLNAGAAAAMRSVGIGPDGVHAATDITGFGLMGHLSNVSRESGAGLVVDAGAVPLLPGALALAEAGHCPGGGGRNEAHLAGVVAYEGELSDGLRRLLYDPQTSGGLAIFVAADREPDLMEALRREGAWDAVRIGRVEKGAAPSIRVTIA